MKIRGIANPFVPSQPRYGCAWSTDGEAGHQLSWAGWWRSGNPDAAIPKWSCTCGRTTTDAPKARRLAADTLGALFYPTRMPSIGNDETGPHPEG